MKKMIAHLLLSLARFLGKKAAGIHGTAASNMIERFFKAGWFASQNDNYDSRMNGEQELMGKIIKTSPKIIVDVGANIGEWSIEAARRFEDADIHAFEAVPSTVETLEKNCVSWNKIKVHGVGLSNEDAVVNFFVSDLSHELSSSLGVVEDSSAREVRCKVKHAGKYLNSIGVKTIDFLKVDVEGMEYTVFMGLEEYFREKKIKIIQFEYGRASILNKKILIDLYEFFESKGYNVGKLWPHSVEFQPYDTKYEDFIGPNYIACLPEYVKELEVL